MHMLVDQRNGLGEQLFGVAKRFARRGNYGLVGAASFLLVLAPD